MRPSPARGVRASNTRMIMGKKKKADAEAPATDTKPRLLWNERGQTGCTLPGHAPHKDSDTWKFEHWQKAPKGATKDDGTPFACERCAKGEPVPAEPEPEPVADAPKKKAKKDVTLAD